MGLMSMFRRSPDDAAVPAKGKRSSRPQASEHEANVLRLRQQARRRLLGAAVLVGVGIVAFPLIFETQPRPVPMDLPIIIPSKEAPGAKTSAAPALPASLPDDAEVQGAASEPSVLPEPAPPPLIQAVPASAVASAPAKALPAAAPADPGRFVVQVGAFADRDTAQVARRKLEVKGIKTYTQVVKTKDGDRIRVRVGPFVERNEAEKVLGQLKGLGLTGTVLTL